MTGPTDVALDGSQNYEEYLETMQAYNFYPMARELWERWQIFHHGSFRVSEGVTS